jgi:hypothetical protein
MFQQTRRELDALYQRFLICLVAFRFAYWALMPPLKGSVCYYFCSCRPRNYEGGSCGACDYSRSYHSDVLVPKIAVGSRNLNDSPRRTARNTYSKK